jgi:hypothetical protein
MLYRQIIAVYSQMNTKHVDKLCDHNGNFVKLHQLVLTVTTKPKASEVLECIFDLLQTDLPTFSSYSQRS